MSIFYDELLLHGSVVEQYLVIQNYVTHLSCSRCPHWSILLIRYPLSLWSSGFFWESSSLFDFHLVNTIHQTRMMLYLYHKEQKHLLSTAKKYMFLETINRSNSREWDCLAHSRRLLDTIHRSTIHLLYTGLRSCFQPHHCGNSSLNRSCTLAINIALTIYCLPTLTNVALHNASKTLNAVNGEI